MRRMTLSLLVGLFITITTIHAQQKELKVLFAGNSYTYGYNLPHIVSIMSEGTDTRLVTRKSVIGGAHLWEHWNGETVRLMNHNPEDAEFCRRIANQLFTE
jgi:hypothetical protein